MTTAEAAAGEPRRAAAPGVVALGASAGGLAALTTVLGGLDHDFPAAVVVVQHLAPDHASRIAELLARRTTLDVKQVVHGTRLRGGTVYVARPDWHVVVRDTETLSLTNTERVRWVRPSVDVLFESAGRVFGARAAVVVLSGTGRDGADGCVAVHRHGGRVIVQDAATSEFAGMPEAAALTGDADVVLPLDRIAAELNRWARQLQATTS